MSVSTKDILAKGEGALMIKWPLISSLNTCIAFIVEEQTILLHVQMNISDYFSIIEVALEFYYSKFSIVSIVFILTFQIKKLKCPEASNFFS